MAYDASNNNQQNQNTVGSNPLSQGDTPSAVQPQDTAPQAPSSQPATFQAGTSTEAAGQAQQAQSASKPASSGMFTNIKKYVEKNKPQAQKMSGAVSQNVGNQATKIAEQAQQKQDQLNQTLQANQAQIDTQKNWATQQVQNIVNPVGNTNISVPSEEDSARFQQLAQSGPTGLTNVGQINLAAENQKMQALGKLAQGANTEQGRMNLLRDTFGKGQQEYSRGMSGLDQLITSGDANARNQMITGTQEQTNNLQNQLGTITTDTNKAVATQDLARKTFGKDIQDLSTNEAQAIDQMMEQRLAREIEGRQGLEELYGQSIQSADQYLANMQNQLGGTNYGSNVEKLIQDAYNNAGVRVSDAEGTNLEAYANAIKAGQDVNNIDTYARSAGTNKIGAAGTTINTGNTMDMLQTGWHKNRAAIASLLNEINKNYASNDLYGVKGLDSALNTSDGAALYDRLAGSQQALLDQYSSLGSGQDVVGKSFSEAARGQNLEQYLAGEGIDKYDVADQTSVDKYNALQRLMGGQDIIDDTRRNTDYVGVDALQNLLNRYKA